MFAAALLRAVQLRRRRKLAVQGLGFPGLGFRVSGLGFRVSGLGASSVIMGVCY